MTLINHTTSYSYLCIDFRWFHNIDHFQFVSAVILSLRHVMIAWCSDIISIAAEIKLSIRIFFYMHSSKQSYWSSNKYCIKCIYVYIILVFLDRWPSTYFAYPTNNISHSGAVTDNSIPNIENGFSSES